MKRKLIAIVFSQSMPLVLLLFPILTRAALGAVLCLSSSDAADKVPARNTRPWEPLPSMPTARSEIACATIGDKVYVVGGIALDGSKRAFESYDARTGQWDKLASLPTKLNHSGVAAWGGTIYVSGGFRDLRQKQFSGDLYAYDVRSDRWRSLGPMPGFRNKHFMIARDGWLHLIGGLQHREIWSYHLATGEWRSDRLAPIPAQRDHIAVLQDKRHLYIVGGREGRVVREACWLYDFQRREWTEFAEIPCPRSAPAAVLHQGRIHVVGGENLETQKVLSRHDVFDLETGRWTQGEPFPRPRHGVASCRIEDRWIVIGGGRKAEIGTVFSATRAVEAMALE